MWQLAQNVAYIGFILKNDWHFFILVAILDSTPDVRVIRTGVIFQDKWTGFGCLSAHWRTSRAEFCAFVNKGMHYITDIQTGLNTKSTSFSTVVNKSSLFSKDLDYFVYFFWRDVLQQGNERTPSLSTVAVNQLNSRVSPLGGLKFFTAGRGLAGHAQTEGNLLVVQLANWRSCLRKLEGSKT